MSTSTACPPPEQLHELLDGRLPAAEHSQLLAHVETCAACQETLASLSVGSQSWEDAAGKLLEQSAQDDQTLKRLLEQMRARGSGGAVTTDGSSALESDSLAFLAPAEKPDQIGKLDHYEVLEVIGRGGMGVVLKAFDPALQRVVAIKVLAPQLATSANARRRFTRESVAAAAVSHDHVVSIHAVAEASGLPYLVMPLIAGESVQQLLDRKGPLELKEILRIGMQTAAGLAAAHAQGLVHRDIKPANILLENGVQRVKITDFGLARAVDDATLTQSGVLAGTPQYMAPEQARGEAVDARADLFSLGSVLYALCTGHAPFRATTTLGVIKHVCEDEARPIRQINPDIPEWLCEIVEKLHAKTPTDRFESAREVADLLEQHLAHLQQPSVAPRPQPLPNAPSRATKADKSSSSSWRIPLAAWIAAIPFAGIYFVAAGDLQQAIDGAIAEVLGVLLLLVAGVYLAIWGVAALFRRWLHGPGAEPTLEPQPWRLVMFFGLLMFFTTLFVGAWAKNPWKRLQSLLPPQSYVEVEPEQPGMLLQIDRNGQTVLRFDGQASTPLSVIEGQASVTARNGVNVGFTYFNQPGSYILRGYAEDELVYASHFELPDASRTTIRPSPQADLARLQGRWVVDSQESAGSTVNPSLETLEFESDRFKEYRTTDLFTLNSFTLNSDRSPSQINFYETHSSVPNAIGIYRLEGDTLTLTIGPTSQPRPNEFVTHWNFPYIATVLRRAETEPEAGPNQPAGNQQPEKDAGKGPRP